MKNYLILNSWKNIQNLEIIQNMIAFIFIVILKNFLTFLHGNFLII